MTTEMKQTVRAISERQIATVLVLTLARSGHPHFGCSSYDAVIDSVMQQLNIDASNAFGNKLRKVIRRLVRYKILVARRGSTAGLELAGGDLTVYAFVNPGSAHRLTVGATAHTGTPEWEATFLLRHAYPKPDTL